MTYVVVLWIERPALSRLEKQENTLCSAGGPPLHGWLTGTCRDLALGILLPRSPVVPRFPHAHHDEAAPQLWPHRRSSFLSLRRPPHGYAAVIFESALANECSTGRRETRILAPLSGSGGRPVLFLGAPARRSGPRAGWPSWPSLTSTAGCSSLGWRSSSGGHPASSQEAKVQPGGRAVLPRSS